MAPLLQKLWESFGDLAAFLRWLVIAVAVGVTVGLVGTAFYFGMAFVTAFRMENEWVVLLLPVAGILIVGLYRMCHVPKSKGTNLVLESVRSDERLPFKMAPLIFISTIITHLFGGSAGREGAALQLGGSLGEQLGIWFHLDDNDMRVITMCGMSAAFSALFGTPMAAAVFAMEVVSVGVMYYAALVPCAVAALIGCGISSAFGAVPTFFRVAGIPEMGVLPAGRVMLLSALCAVVSILFCRVLRRAGAFYGKYLPNGYARAAVGGVLIIALALLFGHDYLGAGVDVIQRSISGQARPEAFLLKMLFTAVTLEAGFKGGEIVPSFFVGATFGCVAGGLLGLSPSFGAAVGLMAVFCGVTNCPLTSLIISMELFGIKGAAFYLLAAAVSYMLSGYSGLYSKQKIMYSKTRTEFINTTAG